MHPHNGPDGVPTGSNVFVVVYFLLSVGLLSRARNAPVPSWLSPSCHDGGSALQIPPSWRNSLDLDLQGTQPVLKRPRGAPKGLAPLVLFLPREGCGQWLNVRHFLSCPCAGL